MRTDCIARFCASTDFQCDSSPDAGLAADGLAGIALWNEPVRLPISRFASRFAHRPFGAAIRVLNGQNWHNCQNTRLAISPTADDHRNPAILLGLPRLCMTVGGYSKLSKKFLPGEYNAISQRKGAWQLPGFLSKRL